MASVARFVLDSYALIGYLEDEPFAEWLQKLLVSARKKQNDIYLHAIHLGEVYYITLREQGKPDADLAYARIKDFPLILLDTIDEQLLLTAAALKAEFPISYADAYAAAMAVIYDAMLLTGDPEFKILEARNIISVKWLDPPPNKPNDQDRDA